MSIEKAEIKIGTIRQFGTKLEDQKEAAEAECCRNEGALGSLKQAADGVFGILQIVEKEAKAGAFDEVKGSLAVCEVVKSYLKKVLGSLDNLATQANVGRLQSKGEIEGLGKAILTAKKILDEESRKAQGIRETVLIGVEDEDGKVTPVEARPVGTHPGPSIAAQRKAEATQKPPKKKAVSKKNGKPTNSKPKAQRSRKRT